MGRPRMTTPTNRTAGADIARRALRQVRSRCNTAGLALKLGRNADAAKALVQLAEVKRSHDDLDALCLELAGAALLAGWTAEQVSDATGIGTAILTRRVPRSLTALRGANLTRDDRAPYGWKADA